jgi:transcriptional regulator GlxA family with amidase domain
VVSICGGAMLLAKPACWTKSHHPLAAAGNHASGFPEIPSKAGRCIFRMAIWTSGGVSSGFDLTLALVEDDYGFSLARDVAQNMVMYLRRPGGQLQFSRYNLQQASSVGPSVTCKAGSLQNLTADLSVDKLAERAAMSPRNFTRVFTRETGASPARYVAEARWPRRGSGKANETLDDCR